MYSENNPVIINSRKYDGSIHKSWKAELINQSDSVLELVGIFEEEVEHSYLGVIRRGTVSYEYFWLNRWYSVFRFVEPEGDLRNFYCNINLPPTFMNGILDYIDLDIDILVWKDFSYQILDIDEFEQNIQKYSYPKEIQTKSILSLEKLIQKIKKRGFPFSNHK